MRRYYLYCALSIDGLPFQSLGLTCNTCPRVYELESAFERFGMTGFTLHVRIWQIVVAPFTRSWSSVEAVLEENKVYEPGMV